jgi:hypothetical protein
VTSDIETLAAEVREVFKHTISVGGEGREYILRAVNVAAQEIVRLESARKSDADRFKKVTGVSTGLFESVLDAVDARLRPIREAVGVAGDDAAVLAGIRALHGKLASAEAEKAQWQNACVKARTELDGLTAAVPESIRAGVDTATGAWITTIKQRLDRTHREAATMRDLAHVEDLIEQVLSATKRSLRSFGFAAGEVISVIDAVRSTRRFAKLAKARLAARFHAPRGEGK